VRYFFNQKPELGPVKFGCIGTSTSAELRSFGKRADFIGQSTDVKLVGKQFSSKVGSAKVLFPIARGSMQSIQWQMVKRENVFNLEVYATLKHSEEIATDFDVLVFTSPSNVEAFFEKNTVPKGQKVVAMGESTGKALEKMKVKDYRMPQTFDDLGILRAILTV
jgi:hydroxymethylbilane synthase